VFICHGEPSASAGLAERLIAADLPASTLIRPSIDQSFRLHPTAADALGVSRTRAAPAVPTSLDWHNARAALQGELDTRLEAAPDDASRSKLIERIRRLVADG